MVKFTFLIIGVVFILLKILNIVEWPWSFVLLPIWIHLTIAILVLVKVIFDLLAPIVLTRKKD